MANKALKGLTIEIGADTSELNAALDKVDKQSQKISGELKDIDRGLKLDPGNTELLAQKQQVLADAISNTEEKLDTLKEAEKQVQKQFERGEVSQEQVRALRREILATEGKLESYKNAAKATEEALQDVGDETEETEDALKDVGDAAEDAAEAVEDTGEAAEDSGDGFTVAKGALAEFIGDGLSALVGAATDAISSFFELAEATREYRNEMAKLNTSFESAGLSADAANKTYKELYGILGDEGAAVEAAQQLAKISKDEKDLAANTRILTGVMAEYGNSIPTEGLAEGMAATAAMGEVQGVLADALEWQGVNLDSFNEKLAGMTTEEERAAFIQDELTKLYGESADAYKETNSAVIEANKSQADLTATQAELGETLEPLTKKMTELKTKALQWLIDTGLPALEKGFGWIKDNIPTITVVAAGLTGAFIAQKIATLAQKAATEGLTIATYAAKIAQEGFNKAMKANAIGLIVTAITLLVAAFIQLWNNCEGFRNFWIAMWEGIKKAAKAVADWFVQAWENVSEFFSGTWDKLVSGAKNAWAGIKNAFSSVTNWFKDTFTKAWQGVKNVFSAGGKIFDGIKEGISSVFTTVVNGIIRGINKVIAVPFDSINGILNFIRNISILDYQPFVGLWKQNPLPVPQIPELARGGVLEKGQVGLLEGDGAEAVVPLEQNTKWLSKVAEQLAGLLLDAAGGLDLERSLQSRTTNQPTFEALERLSPKLDLILAAIENGHVLTIDGDALVGATANRMDNALGRRRALASRGAI